MNDPPRDQRIPELISVREAAALLGISKQAVNKMIQKGRLRGAKVDGFWVFRPAVVRNLASKQTKQQPTQPPEEQQ